MATAALFEEETRLTGRVRQLTIVLLLVGPGVIACVFGYAIYQQIVLGRPFGDDPMSDGALIGLAVGLLCLTLAADVMVYLCLLRGRCTLTVERRRVVIDVRPFGGRKVAVREIAEWSIAPTRHIGVNYQPRAGWVINFGGTHLLTLKLKRGGRATVGTARPEDLRSALETVAGDTADAGERA